MTTRELLKTTTPEEKKLIAEALNKARAKKLKEETQTGNKNPSVSFHFKVTDSENKTYVYDSIEDFILMLNSNFEFMKFEVLKGGKV